MIHKIESGGVLYAVLITGDWDDGLAFYSDDDDFIQVGTWNYDAGKELLAHKHNRVDRAVTHTQEVVHIRTGALELTVYDEDDEILEVHTARQGDTLVMLAGGHGYRILDNDTRVLEVKNGPYPGPEADRTRI